MKRICVFSGSNPGIHPEYEAAATSLGKWIANKGYELVYGGSRLGLMGRVADAAMAAGGKAIGVMPAGLFRSEVVHQGLTEFHEVANMHERKALMSDLADAYISLPGGLGTFEELFEVACWAQIGIHTKPIGLLNVRNFYNPLMDFLAHSATEGFIQKKNLELFLLESNSEQLLQRLAEYKPFHHPNKWTELPQD